MAALARAAAAVLNIRKGAVFIRTFARGQGTPSSLGAASRLDRVVRRCLVCRARVPGRQVLYEAYIPASQHSPRAHARLSRSHGHTGRPQGYFESPTQGPEAP